jgi:hypothetical protein
MDDLLKRPIEALFPHVRKHVGPTLRSRVEGLLRDLREPWGHQIYLLRMKYGLEKVETVGQLVDIFHSPENEWGSLLLSCPGHGRKTVGALHDLLIQLKLL